MLVLYLIKNFNNCWKQVVLKIIKHCQEEGGGGSELVQGVLLGLVDKKCLEVTNCFPFPRHTEEEDFDEGTHSHAISYDSCYRLVLWG